MALLATNFEEGSARNRPFSVYSAVAMIGGSIVLYEPSARCSETKGSM